MPCQMLSSVWCVPSSCFALLCFLPVGRLQESINYLMFAKYLRATVKSAIWQWSLFRNCSTPHSLWIIILRTRYEKKPFCFYFLKRLCLNWWGGQLDSERVKGRPIRMYPAGNVGFVLRQRTQKQEIWIWIPPQYKLGMCSWREVNKNRNKMTPSHLCD